MPESTSTEALPLRRRLPIGGTGRTSTGWWGLWTLVLTEASLFGYLFLCYFYLLVQTHPAWPPEGPPKLLLPGINTALLISSSAFVWLAERRLKAGAKAWSLISLAVAIGLGMAFIAVQLKEWSGKPYGITSNLYGSLFFTITGFHGFHVFTGVVINIIITVNVLIGTYEKRGSYLMIEKVGLYWHFVDLVWVFVFTFFYLV